MECNSGSDRSDGQQDDARVSYAEIRVEFKRTCDHALRQQCAAAVTDYDDFICIIGSHQLLEMCSADFDRPVEAVCLATAKFPEIRPVIVDANHQPPLGKRTQSHENPKNNRDRYGNPDWCSRIELVSRDIPTKRSRCHGSSNPSE